MGLVHKIVLEYEYHDYLWVRVRVLHLLKVLEYSKAEPQNEEITQN